MLSIVIWTVCPEKDSKNVWIILRADMEVLKKYHGRNIALKKSKEDIPVTGMAVLRQQYTLAEAIEEWIASLKKGNQFVKVHGRNKRNAVIF